MAEEAAEEFKNTEIVFLKAGHPPGYCLQSGLFYRSETWFNLIQRDVNGLLDAFVRVYSDPAPSVSLASTSTVTMEQAQEGGEVNVRNSSPFQVFKSIWIRLGWSKIHLFGTVDGPLRKPWSESVFRAFLSHLKQNEDPLVQAASLFAIYIFYGTQPPTMEKTHIQVDPLTLEYIISELPIILARAFIPQDPSLDPPPDYSTTSRFTTTAPSPSLDIDTILDSLISASAFLIIPTQYYLFPEIPSVWIKDAKLEAHSRAAELVLGVEAELVALSKGNITFSPMVDTGERMTIDDENDESRNWVAGLREKEADYLTMKRSILPDSSEATTLAKRVLSRAKTSSLMKLRDVTGAITGGNVTAALGTNGGRPHLVDVNGYDLLDLVGETSNVGMSRNGLNTVEGTFDELGAGEWRKRNAEEAGL